MIVTNDAALTSSQVAKRTPETWLDPIWAQTNSWQAIWVFTDSKLVQKQQRYSFLCVKTQSTQKGMNGLIALLGTPTSIAQIESNLTFLTESVFQCPHDRKKIKNLFIDFIWLNNDQNRCQKWPFSLISPSISDFVLKILKPCKGNQIKFICFFWSFRHRTTFPSQEIWNLTENEAVKGWVYI